MKKIPSVFVRDFEGNRNLVLPKVTPGCEWVLKGFGIPTRKRDGTACMVDERGRLWKRYDAKRGKTPPEAFLVAQPSPDPVTGHWPGWLPVGDGTEDRWYHDAPTPTVPGTYELCGPKIQGNPERLEKHVFFKHGEEPVPVSYVVLESEPVVEVHFKILRSIFASPSMAIEGVVWHCRETGEMAKLKRSDFGLPWPIKA